MTIKNIGWEAEIVLTREEIKALAEVFKFVGNIETLLTENWSSCRKIDWDQVRSSGYKFSSLRDIDKKFESDVIEILKGINEK